jgi:acyl-CoA reductase-like NAD-dependent aldehyde dehydrogenase
MKVGDPAEGEQIEMGPVISREQQERVLGFLERATSDGGGASVVTGGGALGERGFFIRPTVVADVSQDDEIVQREVFGPVVTVQRFSSDDEAIVMANGVRYGLAASVFSRDVGRALSAARKLDFGTIWISEHLFPLASEMPHGGYKQSGYGQGPVAVLAGGLDARQARRREALLTRAGAATRQRERARRASGRAPRGPAAARPGAAGTSPCDRACAGGAG